MTLFKALFVSLINFTGLFPPGVHCGLAVFGGNDGHVELYNNHEEKWEITNMKFYEPNTGYSFLAVKLGDIISDIE